MGATAQTAWEEHASVSRVTNVISFYPSVAPDGSRIMFQSNRTGSWQVFSARPDGSELAQVTAGPAHHVTPVWSPDGATVALVRIENGAPRIHLMAPDGSDLRRLTDRDRAEWHPHWAPDGVRIVFNSPDTIFTDGSGPETARNQIYSVRADGADLRRHTRCALDCTYPAYSPDGRHLVYRSVVARPGLGWDLAQDTLDSEIVVDALDGSGEVNVSRHAAFDGWPAWSPDGRWIVFGSNRAGPARVSQLYAVRPDGTDLRAITSGPWGYAQPSWAPDGLAVFAYQFHETARHDFGDVVQIELPLEVRSSEGDGSR